MEQLKSATLMLAAGVEAGAALAIGLAAIEALLHALRPGQSTPAPWVNVVANPGFGFLVAAEGGGYTWSRNSRENQITPWSNDPVTNRPGETFLGGVLC